MKQRSASAGFAGHSGPADSAGEFDQEIGGSIADHDERSMGGPAMAPSSVNGAGTTGDSVVVYLQLRPRRGSTRRCLAALAALAAEHGTVAVSLSGLSKDDRVVRITLGVDLGSRAEVARFSEQAQDAYGFVNAVFTVLYDHLPVYVAEPSAAERDAAAALADAPAAPASFPALVAVPADGVPAGTVPVAMASGFAPARSASRTPSRWVDPGLFDLAGTSQAVSA